MCFTLNSAVLLCLHREMAVDYSRRNLRGNQIKSKGGRGYFSLLHSKDSSSNVTH